MNTPSRTQSLLPICHAGGIPLTDRCKCQPCWAQFPAHERWFVLHHSCRPYRPLLDPMLGEGDFQCPSETPHHGCWFTYLTLWHILLCMDVLAQNLICQAFKWSQGPLQLVSLPYFEKHLWWDSLRGGYICESQEKVFWDDTMWKNYHNFYFNFFYLSYDVLSPLYFSLIYPHFGPHLVLLRANSWVLVLHSLVPYGALRILPDSVECKASAFSSMLSLWPRVIALRKSWTTGQLAKNGWIRAKGLLEHACEASWIPRPPKES